jgi:hypothetical protein
MKFTVVTFACMAALASAASKKPEKKSTIVSLGPRPYFLVDSMEPSFLKTKLGKLRTVTSFGKGFAQM